MTPCIRCGGAKYHLRKDKKNSPDAICDACGAVIKRMTVAEVMEYYDNIIMDLQVDARNAKQKANDFIANREAPMCRYCTEIYTYKQGRLGTVHIPIEHKYCPMCGRKTKPTDRDY